MIVVVENAKRFFDAINDEALPNNKANRKTPRICLERNIIVFAIVVRFEVEKGKNMGLGRELG
jgi:hypothetical protein